MSAIPLKGRHKAVNFLKAGDGSRRVRFQLDVWNVCHTERMELALVLQCSKGGLIP